MRPRSDAYTLIVRQGPERAKAFPGPPAKEKDRKPVDPPPIVQLRLRDPEDPAQNYLQSPYLFMCCALCDANLERPGQLAAALQGDDVDTPTQSALVGTLVSSLHRLKDVDNTDGGFFVFPDLSVKIEGQFRLRFSLFDMGKTRVHYIKSVMSMPFTVFSHKAFPGLSESTFLSRSFGDQGVKLRIRKEPRVLGKRSAPSDFHPQDTSHGHRQQSHSNYQNMGLPSQHEQVGDYTGSGYDEQPYKRQRMSSDSVARNAYDQDLRSSHRTDTQPRDTYSQYPLRDPLAAARGAYYPQPALQATAPTASDCSLAFMHQRNNYSSTSSPFISPRTEYPNYNFSTPNSLYQQPARDQSYQYTQAQHASAQPRPMSQLAQALPPYRPYPSTVPSQVEPPRVYSRPTEPEDQGATERAYALSGRPDHRSAQPLMTYDRSGQALARTLLPPQNLNSLPPIQSTVPSSQPRRDPLQSYPSSGASSTEGSAQLASIGQSGLGPQNYLHQPYRGQDGG
ncbi:hypothetical protein ABVK25_009752 [Lepraria finkii]|uniref:Velvet domain-containing protein n=1 Tax=Lepraria finkii TaxID=1340010 RepID=A0ABR4AXK9_9LECA